jgi:hypothetical protein
VIFQQIDPSEKLDPEVEDVLIDIAEDFVESVSPFPPPSLLFSNSFFLQVCLLRGCVLWFFLCEEIVNTA